MGFAEGERKVRGPLMCFSISTSIAKKTTHIDINHRSFFLRWLSLRGKGDWGQVGTWVQREMG